MLDYRLVQTAVIGDKKSDLPVILPMDPHELDFWRKAHPSYNYWCGLQLGGCGGELSDRRYTTKVCHFAHHPSAPICRRTANGESSADHLFIKQGVRRLLGERKLRGTVQTRDLGTGPGDAVDVHLAGSRRRLRFQLSPFEYRSWRRAADELAADGDDVDWILASDGPVAQQIVSRHGYCLRVRCETVGGERRVHIGAEARDRSVVWAPLDDCALTPSGIVTPYVEEIRLNPPRPKPLAFPLQGGMVFAPAPDVTAPATSLFAAAGRHLLVADVKPIDGPIARTLVSLPGDTDVPPPEHVYRVLDGARILLDAGGGGWAVEADRYVRLNAHEAQRTGLWTPAPEVHALPSVTSEPSRVPKRPAPVVPMDRTQLVAALRDALSDCAARCSTVTWDQLARTVNPDMATYSLADRCSLLVEVDRPLREDRPVLSALIRKGGAPLPYLPRVLTQLGLRGSETSSDLARWAAVEVERAFAAHGTPPSAMPARHRPGSGHREGPQHLVPHHAAAGTGGGSATHEHPRVQRLRALVRELEASVPRLSRPARTQVAKSIEGARSWLAYHDSAVTPEQRRVLAARVPKQLVRAVEATVQDVRRILESPGRNR